MPMLYVHEVAKGWAWMYNTSSSTYSTGFWMALLGSSCCVFFWHLVSYEHVQDLFFPKYYAEERDPLLDVDWEKELSSTNTRQASAGQLHSPSPTYA